MPNESPAELLTSKKIGEVAEVVEVGQGRSSPVHILESVMDEMAWEESCTYNPDHEVRPSLVLISEQSIVPPTVNPVVSRPFHILERVIDEMACEESCTHNPDQEVRPSLDMISEQSMETPTVNPVVSRLALFQEMKTYADAETQTEPLVSSPIVEPLTPRRKLKLVEKDHAYFKKKIRVATYAV